MNEKVGIIWNPSKIEEETLRTAVDSAISETAGAAPECLWYSTTEEDPGQGAAGNALADGCTVIVAAGGDGTVRAVAERLGETGEPAAELGIVPLGTGNLLARNLDVPLGDPAAAFARILTTDASPLDLGLVRIERAGEDAPADGADGGEVLGFVVMVGFGIDAQMIEETDEDLKSKAGWLAYIESLGRAADGTRSTDLAMSLDGDAPRSETAHTLLVANCGSLQGGFTLLPDARPDDGALDLLLLSADNAGAWLDTMKNLVWDNGLKRLLTNADQAESSDSAEHLRARTVRIELPVPVAFEVDGDTIGEVTTIEAQVLPAALSVR